MSAAEGSFTVKLKFPKNWLRLHDSIGLPASRQRCDVAQAAAPVSRIDDHGGAGIAPSDERSGQVTTAADVLQAVAQHYQYCFASPAASGLAPNVGMQAFYSGGFEDANTPACAASVRKRVLDVIFSSLAIFFLLPLLCLIAISVKASSRGPVIFKQERQGLNGKKFSILKFRSMKVAPDQGHVVQAVKNDFRVTRVGKWLRKTSLDELPQLFNVLRGDMSIVGPRPHAVAHDDYYSALIAGYAQRQRVRPGITGWAQVRGARGETPRLDDMKNRIDHDIWYIENWSFSMDAVIIFLTFRCLAGDDQAY